MRFDSTFPSRNRPQDKALSRDRSGATALEFALLMPILCLMTFSAMALSLALLQWNALAEVSAESARCLAIGTEGCGPAAPDCAIGAGPCFVIQLAAQRGLPGTTADQIEIDPATLVDGLTYTRVSIAYPFDVLGFEMTLTSTSHFPNPS